MPKNWLTKDEWETLFKYSMSQIQLRNKQKDLSKYEYINLAHEVLNLCLRQWCKWEKEKASKFSKNHKINYIFFWIVKYSYEIEGIGNSSKAKQYLFEKKVNIKEWVE